MKKLIYIASIGFAAVLLYEVLTLPDQEPSPPTEILSQQNILQKAELAGDYLIRETAENGKFTYQYDAEKDKVENKYNILRHAGTAYAILELYEKTENQELLDAAERALSYLNDQIEPCAPPYEEFLCVVEKSYTKLGGNGLAIIAMSKYTEVTANQTYIETAQFLASWITAVQSEEGEFTIHKQSHPEGEISDFVSDYYPGEALLALVRLYKIDGNEEWLMSAEKGAKWLINIRDGEKSVNQLEHDHWLLYALNEIYRESPDQIYIDHSFKIVDAILQKQRQIPPEDNPDWLGSYYNPPRSTPTATRSEGLIAAYKLARDFGYSEKAGEILHAIELGITFQLKTQFTEENMRNLSNPDRALGAFHESLTELEVRIDYVQHNISSLLGYLKIIRLLSSND